VDKPNGLNRPGLPAVQKISCVTQEPLMETEQSHIFNMATWVGAFNP